MKTFTEPMTSVRFYESGAVRTVTHEVLVKETVLADDKNVVRLSDSGPYRIVMHCQSKLSTRTDNTKIPNR
jgi:hypothetical protein